MIHLDRYAILGELGRGPRGIVYKARDQLTERLVALKAINPLGESGTRLTLEATWSVSDARAALRLMHPNIVTVYAAGDARGKSYIAMELLKGRGLQGELAAVRPLGIRRSVRIAAQTACGLAYAHEQGVVHRNVKPSNLAILGNDEVRITDFGVAHVGDVAILSGKYTRCMSYMSPERIRGDQAIDERTDIFSLGAVLYEMLTCRLPFNGGAPVEIAGEVLEIEPPLPSELNPEVPPVLDGLVLSMLAKEPDDRTSNLAMILHSLQRLDEELGGRPTATTHSVVIPAAIKAVPLAARAHIPVDQRETRLLTARRLGIEVRERWRIISGVLVIALAATTWLGVSWWETSKLPRSRALATNIESGSANASERSSAGGSPTFEDLANGGPTSPAAAREPAALAEATVLTEPPESAPTVGLMAALPAMKAKSHRRAADVKQPRAKTSGGPLPKTATLSFAVSPWGAVYIDGRFHGTTPPVTTLHVSSGKHLVEVRNSWQPAYLTYATVQAGEVRSIRHEFESGQEVR